MKQHLSPDLFSMLEGAVSNGGLSLSADERRWHEFLVRAHGEEVSSALSEDLRSWLVEDKKWDPEVAKGAARRFRHGLDLLATYERMRSRGL